MTADGRGIRNARLILTDSSGAICTVLSSVFGYYRFTEVAAGEIYILSISSKRVVFENPTQVVNVTEDLDNLNFTAANKFMKLFGSDFIAPK